MQPHNEPIHPRISLGQNFLVDRALIADLVGGLEIAAGSLVVDVGAGRGALTVPLARAAGVADRVRVVATDLDRLRLPRSPYRVVANPPFGRTSALLRRLLDDVEGGPTRADLVVQREVARKHASRPPAALSTASWTPWWEFRLGRAVDRRSFRPVPSVDAALQR